MPAPAQRLSFRPLNFRLLIVEDSRNELKDHVQARLTPDGLTLHGQPELAIPVGTPARSDGNAIFTVWLGDRTLSLQVQDRRTREIPFGEVLSRLLNNEMKDFHPENYRNTLVGRLRDRQEIGRVVRSTKILFIPWIIVAAFLWWADSCGFGRGWEEGAPRPRRGKFWGGLALVFLGPPLFFMSCTFTASFMKSLRTKPEEQGGPPPAQEAPADGPLAENAAHRAKVILLSFSPDGQFLISCAEDQKIKVWEVATGKHVGTMDKNVGAQFKVDMAPDGKLLASAGGGNTVHIWDMATRTEKASWNAGSPLKALAFAPGSDLLATSTGNEIVLLESATGKEKQSLKGHTAVAYPVFSPKGKMLASTSWDNTIKLWDLNSFSELKTLTGHKDRVLQGAFSPDGTILATASADNTIKLWDPMRYQELASLQEAGHQPNQLNFSPDGTILASSGPDGQVHVWDVAKRQLRFKAKGYIPVFSPDSKVLMTCNGNNVHFWDIARNGKDLGDFQASADGRNAQIAALVAPPIGSKVAVAYLEFVKLWDIRTPAP